MAENPRLDVNASGLTEEVVGSGPLMFGVTGMGFTSVGDMPFQEV